MSDAKVLSVNVSEKKGTVKHPVDEILVTETGVMSDAHSGKWHRQVSLLAAESVERFSREAKRPIGFGEFAENITTRGLELRECGIFDRFRIGDAELELTQIGKECHGDSCAIFKEVGNCVMPKEGIFCRVRKTGTIRPGQEIVHVPKVLRVLVVTLSDRASGGEYEDRSGPKVREILDAHFSAGNTKHEIGHALIPDDAEALRSLLMAHRTRGTDFVFTTGGTGIGDRDITVETVSGLLDKQLPGIMELIRVKYGMENPKALLSRSVAGVMGETLVYTLPGSVRAVEEYLREIAKTMEHSLFMLHGIDGQHA
ncbi:MAG: MOSC domain-containing protein [Deltaproteobacteria bacterium]|nr:MOSC domain-containing protein [Deltaproteobacteria bacterium]